MIQINMSQEEYEAAISRLQSTHGVGVTFLGDSKTIGHFASPDYAADFKYADGVLDLENGQKHGMAHFASDDQIKQHMEVLLGALSWKQMPNEEAGQEAKQDVTAPDASQSGSNQPSFPFVKPTTPDSSTTT